MAKKTKEQISYNMSQVRSTYSVLEKAFAHELTRRGITTYLRNDKTIYGKPDFVFKARKIAVFCDSEFWHGFDMERFPLELLEQLPLQFPLKDVII